jgi:pimeloyl-ACP methyl ester carboxylesterase
MWSYQVAHLADRGLRCITYDRRGHGRSDPPTGPFDLDTLADDLAAVIEGLDLHDLVLVGHSVGTNEIVRYLGRHGTDRIAKVVLLAPTTPFALKTEDNPHGAPAAYFEQLRSAIAKDFPQWIEDNKKPFFTPGTSPAMMNWVAAELLRTPVSIGIATNRAVVGTDLRPDLPKINRPVLILQGDKDVSAPLDLTGRRTAAGIPGAVLKVYPGAPHGLFITHMEQVNHDLLEFVHA